MVSKSMTKTERNPHKARFFKSSHPIPPAPTSRILLLVMSVKLLLWLVLRLSVAAVLHSKGFMVVVDTECCGLDICGIDLGVCVRCWIS